jgi:large subunit ribosomal protein L25
MTGAPGGTLIAQTELKIEPRFQLGAAAARRLRRAGQIPGIVYGHEVEPVPVTVDARELARVFGKAGRTQLLDLKLDREKRPALIREVQRDPRQGGLQHVDFYQVNLLEKITAAVPVVIVGESPKVAAKEADLIVAIHELQVECLPSDLPAQIECDVSGLLEIDDEIRVRDLKIPAGVELEAGPDDMVAKVAVHHAPKAEEILVAPEEVGEAAVGEAAPAEAAEGEEKAAVAKPGEAKAAPAKAAPAKGERAEKGEKEKPARG